MKENQTKPHAAHLIVFRTPHHLVCGAMLLFCACAADSNQMGLVSFLDEVGHRVEMQMGTTATDRLNGLS